MPSVPLPLVIPIARHTSQSSVSLFYVTVETTLALTYEIASRLELLLGFFYLAFLLLILLQLQ
jgi:hypothetical protein